MQKKYHKITGLSRQLSLDTTKTINNKYFQAPNKRNYRENDVNMRVTPKIETFTPSDGGSAVTSYGNQKQQGSSQSPMAFRSTSNSSVSVTTQPLNLSKCSEVAGDNLIQCKISESETPQELMMILDHPQNPERSIIKDLLLNSKQFGVIAEGEVESLFVCQTCKKAFHTADLLKYHTVCHCSGSQIQINSSIHSSQSSTYQNMTSDSKLSDTAFNFNTTNTISDIEFKTLNRNMHVNHKNKLRPDNLKLNKEKHIKTAEEISNEWKEYNETLSSPGPMLGKTRLLDTERSQTSNTATFIGQAISNTFESSSTLSNQPFSGNSNDSLKMFGGVVKIKNYDENGINLVPSNSSVTKSSISPSLESSHKGLFSGGTALQIENENENIEKLLITPKLVLSIVPNLTCNMKMQDNKPSQFVFPSHATTIGQLNPFPSKNDNENKLEVEKMIDQSFCVNPSFTPITSSFVRDDKDFFKNSKVAATINNNKMDVEPSVNKISSNNDKPFEPKVKFLRPSSLPLKPGTFPLKKHHGITPTTNTLPLISPDTPRISKNCLQLYINGHAYTFLGLKCSTKPYYCTINKPQPSYIATKDRLSMYSNWQIYPENNPHPLKIKPVTLMSLYDSRQIKSTMTIASSSDTNECKLVFSQTTISSSTVDNLNTGKSLIELRNNPIHSYDETYVRGRGRGKYICNECGIRCKKPSMLKKHIRTHTDIRPFTCVHCKFSFKTKGNLTKHMKSKTHYKKCIELGLSLEELTDQIKCYSESKEPSSSNMGDNSCSDNTTDADESESEGK